MQGRAEQGRKQINGDPFTTCKCLTLLHIRVEAVHPRLRSVEGAYRTSQITAAFTRPKKRTRGQAARRGLKGALRKLSFFPPPPPARRKGPCRRFKGCLINTADAAMHFHPGATLRDFPAAGREPDSFLSDPDGNGKTELTPRCHSEDEEQERIDN